MALPGKLTSRLPLLGSRFCHPGSRLRSFFFPVGPEPHSTFFTSSPYGARLDSQRILVYCCRSDRSGFVVSAPSCICVSVPDYAVFCVYILHLVSRLAPSFLFRPCHSARAIGFHRLVRASVQSHFVFRYIFFLIFSIVLFHLFSLRHRFSSSTPTVLLRSGC